MTAFDVDETNVGVASPDVLRKARRVGPDSDTDIEAEREPQLEPWEIPVEPPPPARLEERSIEDVFARLRDLTLAQSRAFQRAYESIPRSELDLGGWAQASGRVDHDAGQKASLDDIAKARAMLRDGAGREARANGADVETEAEAARVREAVVEALSHASLRGGGLEEATVAAQVAAQDVAVALTLRQWIAPWRFDELVEPWTKAFSIQDTEARSFDVLGLAAVALGVMAFAALGMGRTSLDAGDLWVFVFAALAAAALLLRWRLRRQQAPG